MKTFASVIFILMISVWTILPLFHNGFFPIHDNAQLARVFVMSKALGDGMFPVHWSDYLGFNYGYPLFNFYAPLVYYFGGFIVLLGSSVITSTKITIGAGMLLAGISMFIFSRKWWGNAGGIISGLVYTYATYHAVNLYVRGDIPEVWAYGIAPLVFWGFTNIFITCERFKRNNKEKSPENNHLAKGNGEIFKWTVIAAVCFAALILTHNLTAMMLTPFLLLFCLFLILQTDQKLYIIGQMIYAFFLGLGLSAIYWLPVFPQISYTDVLSNVKAGFDFHKHFICIPQFWYSPWGYGGSVQGCIDGMSFMLNKVTLILTLLSLPVACTLSEKNKQLLFIIFSWLCLITSLLLTTELTTPVWELIKPMAFFQFPWRFLLPVSFFIAVLSGVVVWWSKELLRRHVFKNIIFSGICLVIVFGLLFFSTKYFIPKAYYEKVDYLFNPEVIAWDISKESSEYLPQGFARPKDKKAIPAQTFLVASSEGKVLSQKLKTQVKEAVVALQKPANMHINIAYFPAWTAFIDGKKTPLKQQKTGMSIKIPKGKHIVVIRYIQTPIEQLGNSISLASLCIIVIGIIIPRKKI